MVVRKGLEMFKVMRLMALGFRTPLYPLATSTSQCLDPGGEPFTNKSVNG